MLKLQVNDKIMAVTDVNLRDAPNGNRIGQIPRWTYDTILDGPFHVNNLVWWKMTSGFVAEQAQNSTPLIIKHIPDNKFHYAFGFVIGQEGGYVYDENDKGGETKFGIAANFNTMVNVKLLDLSGAYKIYHEKYWMPLHIDGLGKHFALAVFDYGVNAGLSSANRLLELTDDFKNYNELRRAEYKRMKQFNLYGEAWLRRVDMLEEYIKVNP